MIDNFQGEYRFLSNFYDCLVDVKGRLFASSEHAYQAAKTLDPVWQNDIRLARSPLAAKKLGRQAPLRPDWNDVKIDVMRFVLAQKFKERSALADKLVLTFPHDLVEGNDHGDDFWGCVLVNRTTPWDGDEEVPCWSGDNWLGRLLMERREILRHDHRGVS